MTEQTQTPEQAGTTEQAETPERTGTPEQVGTTEQTGTPESLPAPEQLPAPESSLPAPEQARTETVEPKPRRSRKALLLGIARWTAAVLVCGGVGAGTAMGITALDRSDVPGLATASDGRWEYPELTLPALPEGSPRPFSDGNDGEIHHADLRRLLLPAPAGATADPKLKGGWAGLDSYLALLKEKDRAPVKEYAAESALRHVAARGWTAPDGTTTRIHLLRFSSVAYAEAFKDETMREVSQFERLPLGVDASKIDMSTKDIVVPGVSAYAYTEDGEYGTEQTRWAYIAAGDTFGVITQTRKGEVLTVPFQQTVALQAQLLG